MALTCIMCSHNEQFSKGSGVSFFFHLLDIITAHAEIKQQSGSLLIDVQPGAWTKHIKVSLNIQLVVKNRMWPFLSVSLSPFSITYLLLPLLDKTDDTFISLSLHSPFVAHLRCSRLSCTDLLQ